MEPMLPVGILAGGLGTRLSEETAGKPKPMVEIGGMPVLWHIMQIFGVQGSKEFFIALGYKGEVIKDFFLRYQHRVSDFTINLANGQVTVDHPPVEDWRVHLMDTGLHTQTGGRVKQLLQQAGGPMFLTYGDGVSDVDLSKLLAFHRKNGRLATVTAVLPPGRFGEMKIHDGRVQGFEEKPGVGERWINGGFFVLEPGVANYIDGDATIFEQEPLQNLVKDGQLGVYEHQGFWQCMDALRDVRILEDIWQTGKAPWILRRV